MAFAHQLAARGYEIVLTARSLASMEAVAKDLAEKYGRDATIIPLDLFRAR
ncbi:hypothetical protein D9M69_712550 [compost metagenome]